MSVTTSNECGIDGCKGTAVVCWRHHAKDTREDICRELDKLLYAGPLDYYEVIQVVRGSTAMEVLVKRDAKV